MFQGRTFAALAAAAGAIALAPAAASAATLTVDDDRAQCPSAPYSTIQAAVDAAAAGDTVAVCAGTYREGPGTPGTNALTIGKSLTLKGAGADLVTIVPRDTSGGQIAEAGTLDLRNGVGDVVAITGTPASPLTVDVTGVTIDGDGVFSEAGLVFLDAQGTVDRARVTGIVTSQAAAAFAQPGGYRSNDAGFGIVQATASPAGALSGVRTLRITSTRVDEYNKAGVLIAGATGETLPLTASGIENRADIVASQIVGRLQCIDFESTGNCSSVGLLTTGPTFGQDGVRITGGASATMSGTLVSQNLVNGTGAPTRDAATNNANLTEGAGIRLLGAAASSFTRSNITDNAYGVLNLGLSGTTAGATPVSAVDNWWGLNYAKTVNAGPAISPTTNPPVPENPVNGAPLADGAGTTSSLVDFFPFRNGNQASPTAGEWPVLDAPRPVADAAPVVSLTTDDDEVDAGASVTLTATPEDDFGIASVAFYDGATIIGTVTTGAYTETVDVPSAAACGVKAFTAVATDSLGQTASSSTTVTVRNPASDAAGCKPPAIPQPPVPSPAPPTPVPPAPGMPRVAFAAPSGSVVAAGTTFAVAPSAEAGIAKVEVFLGLRKVCELRSAPYACRVLPTGADVGRQTLLAIVTDGLGRTATAGQPVSVAKFRPAALSLAVASKNVSSRTSRKTISGAVKRPARVTAAQGCAGGRVTLVVKRGRTTIANSQVKLSKSCTFSKSLTVAKRPGSSYTVSARFGGTTVLSAASTTRRFS